MGKKNLFSLLNLSQKYGKMISLNLGKHSKFDLIRISENSITYATVTFITFHF